ncbi:hypothetical protein NFX46_39270 [Streptomyces phaeoluteigriseus]|uniref:DUF3037 domain-containing protein n=1 Tax=Streptomyces phaeoluteigriseus TaxID=114686 RepID=A0ABY4ZK29_9ACTN|nr:hypothetical protein [Streptomyces phaeoluteigriseus]USQ89251.1 hypothetical protein NFX46_39270 [Streptomyces phaeoluteigriseus]
MSNGWFLVKYVDDVFRNEPINIGVVVTSGNEMGSHFLGQRPDGSINGQRINKRISGVETYKAWVRFIEKEAARGNLDARIESLSKRVGESYVIERRGPILDSVKSPQDIADELFVALVSAEVAQTQSLDNLADAAFKRLAFPAGRKIERDVDFKVKVRNVPQLVTFDYRYAAEQTILMDRVSFSRPGKPLAQSINDLLYRIEVTEEQQAISSFVALYSGADFSPQIEAQLRLLDRFAFTVDLNSERAQQDLSAILGVPVLA